MKIHKGGIDLRHCVQCVFVLAPMAIGSPAFGFNAGPYFLGMSSAKAREVGIEECVPDRRDTIKCRPTSWNGLPVKEAAIWFDSKTKKANSIALTISYSYLPVDDPFQEHMDQLRIKKCPKTSSITANEQYEDWCYQSVGNTRLITNMRRSTGTRPFKPYQSIQIRMEVDRSHVKAFEKKREERLREVSGQQSPTKSND